MNIAKLENGTSFDLRAKVSVAKAEPLSAQSGLAPAPCRGSIPVR